MTPGVCSGIDSSESVLKDLSSLDHFAQRRLGHSGRTPAERSIDVGAPRNESAFCLSPTDIDSFALASVPTLRRSKDRGCPDGRAVVAVLADLAGLAGFLLSLWPSLAEVRIRMPRAYDNKLLPQTEQASRQLKTKSDPQPLLCKPLAWRTHRPLLYSSMAPSRT